MSNVEYSTPKYTNKTTEAEMKENLPSICVISPCTIKDITIFFY